MTSPLSQPRIAVVANTSWFLYNFRLPLLKEYLTRGAHVCAISPFDNHVDKLKKLGIFHINIKIARSGINPFTDIALIQKLVYIYKRYRPDIVQHFTSKPVIYGTMAARFCHIPYIFNMIPGMGYVFTGKNIKKFFVQTIVRFLYRNTMKFSHHIFFQNKDDRDYFLRFKLVPKEKTSIVPGTGVDIKKYKSCKRKKKKNVIFMIAARMLWDKGIGDFVEATRILKKKYKHAEFWLLGPIDLQNPKAIKSEQLNRWQTEGSIEYLGMTDNIKSFYKNADVIVLPSYYKEGIPLSLLEGAAMGMPIITTDSTGCRDVVENGKNGYLIPAKNISQLVFAMEQFIIDPSKIIKMGEQSRKIAVRKFDSRKIVKQILKYYPF